MRYLPILLLAAGSLPAGDLYFPPKDDAKWDRITPAKAGWKAEAIDAALDFAKSRRSSGVVILYRGRVMAERQWDPPQKASGMQYAFERSADGQIMEDIASCQKSVAAVLFGIAQKKGLVRIDDVASKHLGKGWSKLTPEQEQKITMRHLLTMTSGTSDSLEFEAEPGTKWRYNSSAYQKTMRALAKVTGKSPDALTKEWLTGPLDMQHSRWQERDRMPGMLGFVSTARDMARFGLMIQAGGVWAGRTIVEDKDYLRHMLDSSQDLNRAYGYLWWLNGRPVARPTGKVEPKLISTAPDDLVAALGALGRKIYVVPSLGIVATRTGDNADLKGEAPFDREFWRLLMLAAPAR